MKQHLRLACGMTSLVILFGAGDPAKADLNDGLVAHWKLDETGGDRVADSAGSQHGVNRGAEVGRPGLLGTAFYFDHRRDDVVELGDGLQLDGGNRATVSALVRPESFQPPDARNRANSRNGILGSAGGDFIFALSDRGRPTFVWDAGTNQYQQLITDFDDAVPLGAYSHVAVTRDGPNMTLYINGVARKTADRFSPGPFVRFDRMQLGRVNGNVSRDFHGRIDDVRVYDRALSAKEVWQLAELAGLAGVATPAPPLGARGLQRVPYHHPGLTVDLGVGLWALPLPMDYDGDGDHDLVVSCADVPYNGTYFFENTSGNVEYPVFAPAVRIGSGHRNITVSHVQRAARVLTPGHEHADLSAAGFDTRTPLPAPSQVHGSQGRIRANQWKLANYDGDRRLDLIVGIGDWADYGWDNAFDAEGRWTRGPLHGFVYLLRNTGRGDAAEYEKPVKLEAGGKPIDVFGMPSPNLEDFDRDGDLDLLCGEFVDKLTYFENVGTRTKPRYAAGRHLTHEGKVLRMDLCMIVPSAIDWDRDGDVDLVVGEEDGRVALVENTGSVVDGMPQFLPPKHFQQQADCVKFGALVTPVSVDWDADGDEDLICGNTAGYIGWIENLDGGNPPKWAAPKTLQAAGRVIRIEAGYNGSIQGPCEAKWGYTTLSVADWDHDGLLDLVVNSIWGKVLWYRNVGTPRQPKLAAAEPVEVEWPGKPPKPAWNWWRPQGKQLATQWRTTPGVIDLNEDGLNDLVMLDHEGYLAWFERVKRDGQLKLLPPKQTFVDEQGEPLRLNAKTAGGSGRRKLCFADWDGDGRIDLLVNSRSVDWLRNVATRDGRIVLRNMGPFDSRRLAGHTTSPTTVDWDGNGIPDLLIGAEDGFLYYLQNPRSSRE